MSSTEQLTAFDDIAIPPPRVAQAWYCTKCGEPGAKAEPGVLTIDPRYAVGYCECTGGRHNRVSGYQRERVALVADFAWDKRKWEAQQREMQMRKAWEKMAAGVPLKPDEKALAMKYRARLGIEDGNR